jgi:hypothetical protein
MSFENVDASGLMTYSPDRQLLFVAGKKGKINLFDIRQRQLLDSFYVNDHGIKGLIAVDETDHLFSYSSRGEVYMIQLSELSNGNAKSQLIASHDAMNDKPTLGLQKNYGMFYKDGVIYTSHDGTFMSVFATMESDG